MEIVNNLTRDSSNLETAHARMASLKTICVAYDWKYDTIYKKWKRGEFVCGYRDPAGRGIRFDLIAVDAWAKSCPILMKGPSLIAREI